MQVEYSPANQNTAVYFAGLSNVCDDVQFMLGKRPNVYWRITWSFFAPVILAVIILVDF
jgi:hypothetical protein